MARTCGVSRPEARRTTRSLAGAPTVGPSSSRPAATIHPTGTLSRSISTPDRGASRSRERAGSRGFTTTTRTRCSSTASSRAETATSISWTAARPWRRASRRTTARRSSGMDVYATAGCSAARMRIASGTWSHASRSPHPGVDLSRLVAPRLEQFAAADGLELSGWLYVPRMFAAPGPVVLSFHGGPEAQERPSFNRTYEALMSRGIAVFAPNVRGSSGFGKTFVHLDDREKRFDGVRDIAACVDHVVRIGIADPKRIGITGGSYGGYMTMAGITEFPERFAAAVCVCGIVNFRTFFQKTEPWMAAISKSEYGDPDDGDLLDRLSPIHRMDRVRTPTLVLHGANDTNCPVVEAEQMVDEIGRRGVPVELVLFPDEGHGFLKTANRVRAAVETVRWFERHLG